MNPVVGEESKVEESEDGIEEVRSKYEYRD